MEIKQISTILKEISKEAFGEEGLEVAEDLGNIVDVGDTLANKLGYTTISNKLVDRIGKVYMDERVYKGAVPSVMYDNWEYGSISQLLEIDMPEEVDNDTWALVNGQSIDPYTVVLPTVYSKYYNKKTTFEVDITITEEQIKQAFTSAQEMNRFISMIYNAVEMKMVADNDELIMRTINNMIGETVYTKYSGGAITGEGNTRAVNLLKLYNDKFGASLTATEACQTPSFVRFAIYTLKLYKDRLTRMSVLFNEEGRKKFTPADDLRLIVLSDLEAGATAYLQSDAYNKELVALPNHDTVPYWQGTGTDYDFGSTSKIDVKTASGHSQVVTGILAVMFDKYALGVTQYNRRVRNAVNGKGEYTNYFYKQDAQYFNNFAQNFVVFFVA